MAASSSSAKRQRRGRASAPAFGDAEDDFPQPRTLLGVQFLDADSGVLPLLSLTRRRDNDALYDADTSTEELRAALEPSLRRAMRGLAKLRLSQKLGRFPVGQYKALKHWIMGSTFLPLVFEPKHCGDCRWFSDLRVLFDGDRLEERARACRSAESLVLPRPQDLGYEADESGSAAVTFAYFMADRFGSGRLCFMGLVRAPVVADDGVLGCLLVQDIDPSKVPTHHAALRPAPERSAPVPMTGALALAYPLRSMLEIFM